MCEHGLESTVRREIFNELCEDDRKRISVEWCESAELDRSPRGTKMCEYVNDPFLRSAMSGSAPLSEMQFKFET